MSRYQYRFRKWETLPPVTTHLNQYDISRAASTQVYKRHPTTRVKQRTANIGQLSMRNSVQVQIEFVTFSDTGWLVKWRMGRPSFLTEVDEKKARIQFSEDEDPCQLRICPLSPFLLITNEPFTGQCVCL